MPPGAIAKAQTAARKTAGCNCFVGSTEVLTPTGEKAIEQIKVGQRVLTYAPGEYEGPRAPVTELDPTMTKQITLTLGEDTQDTGKPVTTVVLLRSDEWIESKRLEVGGTIPLDLAELGVKGKAMVAAIEDCPELEEALPGAEGIDPEGTRLVTATFHHTRGYPLDLKLEGLDTPIGVTKHHLIYSEDRRDWVQVGNLETHERVRVAGDVFEVEYAHERPQAEAVYNLEVDGDHVYRVTDAGLLVHNTSACPIQLVQPGAGLFVGPYSKISRILERNRLKGYSPSLDLFGTRSPVLAGVRRTAHHAPQVAVYRLPESIVNKAPSIVLPEMLHELTRSFKKFPAPELSAVDNLVLDIQDIHRVLTIGGGYPRTLTNAQLDVFYNFSLDFLRFNGRA